MLLPLSVCCCKGQNDHPNQGHAFLKYMRYDSKKKEYVLDRQLKYIYYDSALIVERDQLNRYTNMVTGEKKIWTEIIGYTYVDLRTKSFYLYKNFSDTAKIEDSYLQPIKGRPKGGWSFFKKPSKMPYGSIPLEDTAINNVIYKRIKSYHPWETGGTDTSWHQIYFFDCDSKTPFLNVGKASDGPRDCVITRIESHTYKNDLKLYDEIKIVPQKLTLKEIKVFASWKRNVKKYPVRK